MVHSSAGLLHFIGMVWRSLSDIAFSDAKQLLVGYREQLGIKDAEFDSKVSHSFKTEK